MLSTVLLLACLMQYVHLGTGETTHSKYICEHQSGTITCGSYHKIHVLDAFYGRSDTSTCRDSSDNPNTRCRSGPSQHKIQANCNNKQSCSLLAENDEYYGDPCPGTFKYVYVRYECIRKSTILKSVKGRHDLKISVMSTGFGSSLQMPVKVVAPEQCPNISHCPQKHCVSNIKSVCQRCDDYHWKLLNDEHDECARTCNHDTNQWCWPGECGGGFAKNCKCQTPEFRTVRTGINAFCRLIKKPDIETCLVNVVSNSGENIGAKFAGTTACKNMYDTFTNFVPVKFNFTLQYDLTVAVTQRRPPFIAEASYGITGGYVKVIRRDISGHEINPSPAVYNKQMPESEGSKETPKATSNFHSMISTRGMTLQNGQRICANFVAKGGGYLVPHDQYHNRNEPKHFYVETQNTRELCFWFDNKKPEHCYESKHCPYQPIQINARITRLPSISIECKGWNDPSVDNGKTVNASGIKAYEVSIHNVIGGSGPADLIVDTSNVFAKTFASPEKVTFELPRSGLYAVYLGVVDRAGEGNVKSARRFILYDNDSSIVINSTSAFDVTSAVKRRGAFWQKHHRAVCYNWRGRYYNDRYQSSNLLKRIKHDSLYSGVYEQDNGPLPVSGTPHINGITGFNYSWHLNTDSFGNISTLGKFKAQSVCVNTNVKDGDTVVFNVTAIDVIGNTLNENMTVFIDSSPPEIRNVWLQRDDEKSVYVHNSADLSKVNLTFQTFDRHSGLEEIRWMFGSNDRRLGNGSISVNSVAEDECKDSSDCYCPSIGSCEMRSYFIDMRKVGSVGEHNRDYFFTLYAKNKAGLQNFVHIDILVDISPPVIGIVKEGSVDGPDIDYTDTGNVIVNWHGFIDHESGIRRYRVALARTCLSKTEMVESNILTNDSVWHETTETVIKLSFPGEGEFYSSVIAFNNAMEPSDVSCSDGIVFDQTSITITNFIGASFVTDEGIACINNDPWMITKDLKRIRLDRTDECMQKCANKTFPDFHTTLDVFKPKANDSEYSHGLCSILPPFTGHVIYIPHDTINLKWKYHDEYSQLRDFMVGFGSGETSADLEGFKSTSARPFYKKSHEGLASQTKFWILVQATNKAGVTSVTSIGPVVIDETPPLLAGNILSSVDNKHIYVGWSNTTLNDPEYEEPDFDILFRICTESVAITPFLQSYDSLNPCLIPNADTCFAYPINRLRPQDTESGDEYFVELRVFNKAGHFTSARTDNFLLPSRLPPSPGTVRDINIAYNDTKDVDFYSLSDTVCVYWDGFSHHRNVSFEVGLGMQDQIDDVIAFKEVFDRNTFCVNSDILQQFVKYFFTVRASCSGGSVVVSSDGFTVINITAVEDASLVFNGIGCKVPSMDISRKFLNNTITITTTDHFLSEEFYTARVSRGMSLMRSSASEVSKRTSENFTEIEFIPNHNTNQIMFECDSEASLSCSVLALKKCTRNIAFQTSVDHFSIHWKIPDKIKLLHPLVQIAISINDIPSRQFESISGEDRFTFARLNLTPLVKYKGVLKLCFGNICTYPIVSKEFQIIERMKEDVELKADVKQNATCTFVSMLVLGRHELLSVPRGRFYQWSITTESGGHDPYFPWNTISTLEEEFSVCLPSSFSATFRKGYACVRAIGHDNYYQMSCRGVRLSKSGSTEIRLYDIAQTAERLPEMLSMYYTQHLGDNIDLFEESELDYVTSKQEVGGILTGSEADWFDFYLTHKPVIPKDAHECQFDLSCLMHFVTDNGYIFFKELQLQDGETYYICARTHINKTNREDKMHVTDRFELCSDGFYVDDTAPRPGDIRIAGEQNGFITSGHIVTIHWKDFSEDVPLLSEEYTSSIASYDFALGSLPGTDDIIPYTVSTLPNKAVNNVEIPNGKTFYVSVRGTNYANLSSVSTSQPVTVDATPPVTGTVTVGGTVRTMQYISGSVIGARLDGFRDDESGLEGFWISVVSENGMTVIPSKLYQNDDFVLSQINTLQDGHSYFLQCRTVNRAGLSTLAESKLFTIDNSPPSSGVLYEQSGNKTDVDYKTTSSDIYVTWRHFNDHHSGIDHFEVGLGTSSYTQDVYPFVDVGLSTSFTWSKSLVDGQKYFTTVKAFNGAGLSSTMSSDGVVVDSSPPIPGIVLVGGRSRHQKYLSQTSSLSVRWLGFEDPHSSIDHFDWCIGTNQHECDVMPLTSCALSNAVFKPGLHLSIQKDLFVRVRASNRAGLYTESISDSFQVDNTPPTLSKRPFFLSSTGTDTSLKRGYQFDDSISRIGWQFTDRESNIMKTIVSLVTHNDGRSPMDDLILGNENRTTIVLNSTSRLMSGDRYTVKVTACNNAHLCTTGRSRELIIDTTPPHIGGFRLPFKWQNSMNKGGIVITKLNLSWYGFIDPETGIQNFFVRVGETRSGDKLSNGTLVFPWNTTSAIVHLTRQITPHMDIVLTISASNKAGLMTKEVKTTVEPLFSDHNKTSGSLEIKRYACTPLYCDGSCTCSVVGKRCPKTHCFEVQQGPLIDIRWGLDDEEQLSTASSSCVSAHWTIETNNVSNSYMRFQWSVGVAIGKAGEGFFDHNEYPWIDVGTIQRFTHCLKHERTLKHDTSYIVHVRAWINSSQYRTFKSKPLKIDITSPHINKKAAVTESINLPCGKDARFVNSNTTMCACWKRVFTEPETSIVKYEVMMGTDILGDDIIQAVDVGLQTTFCTRKLLSEGTKYFFTIRAFNELGLHSTLSSDGFVVDDRNPYSGVVFNAAHHKNTQFHTQTDSLSASWHGFQDQHSYIKEYFVSVINVNNTVIKDFLPVGLQTSVKMRGLNLKNGNGYRIAVKAIDAAGYHSDVSYSPEIGIDITPPFGFECPQYEQVLYIENTTDKSFSFNVTKDRMYMLNLSILTASEHVKPTIKINTQRLILPMAHQGDGLKTTQYYFLSPNTGLINIDINVDSKITHSLGSLSQCQEVKHVQSAMHVEQMTTDQISVRVNTIDMESGIRSVSLGAGTTKHGFQIQPLKQLPGDMHTRETIQVPVAHGNPIFVTAVVENGAGLKSVFESKAIILDFSPPVISNFKVSLQSQIVHNSTYMVVQGNYTAEDRESGVKHCQFAVGSSSGKENLQSWSTCQEAISFFSEPLDVVDGMEVFPSIRCINNVGPMMTKSFESLPVSLQRPDVTSAEIDFIKETNTIGQPKHVVQKGRSNITFHWAGITDNIRVEQYMCKLSEKNRTLVDWTNVGSYDYVTFRDLELVNGHTCIAEVKAVNIGNYASDTVLSSITVESRKPLLTGSELKTSFDGVYHYLDWDGVFDAPSEQEMVYHLSVGSRQGYTDILNQEIVENTNYKLHLRNDVTSVYLVIHAVLETGNSKMYTSMVTVK